jgi:hypothetical protein
MHGIVLQQVSVDVHRAQVVDGDEVDIIATGLHCRTHRQPADAAKTINRYPNRHRKPPSLLSLSLARGKVT